MSKPNTFAAALKDFRAEEAPKEQKSKQVEKKTTVAASKEKAPSRTETRLIGGHFPAEVAKQVKQIAADDDTTVQSLLEEALNLLFAKKGRKSFVFDKK